MFSLFMLFYVAQLHVYLIFIDFPFGCTTFKGPHTLQCYRSLWIEAGCTEKGLDFPILLDIVMQESYYDLNLKYAVKLFDCILVSRLYKIDSATTQCFSKSPSG